MSAQIDLPPSIALLGGEGLRPESTPLWRRLVAPGEAVTLVPPAFDHQPTGHAERRTQLSADSLVELGAIVSTLDAESALARLDSAAAIYLPGGEPRAIVERLAGSAVWNAIRRALGAGKRLIASGGAAVTLGDLAFAPLRPYPADLDDLAFESFPALGLLPGTIVMPYFGWLQDAVFEKVAALSPPDHVLVGLDDQAALLWIGGTWEAAGLGTVTLHQSGNVPRIFDPGARLPADLLPNPTR